MRQPFTTAVLLTFAGALPFLALGALILLDPDGTAFQIQLLVSYGAIILSFLGAVHWGFALRESAHPVAGIPLAPAVMGAERRLLVLGVIPALVGWVALITMLHFAAPVLALFILLAGFLLTIIVETIGKGRGVVATNYLIMRWGVSVLVLLVLCAVLFTLLSGMRTD
jgi:hypothetical protein